MGDQRLPIFFNDNEKNQLDNHNNTVKMMTMIEFYKHITGGVAEYLLFLFIVLVALGGLIHFIKSIIEAVGEQVVKAIFAYKTQLIVNAKNPSVENSGQ